MIRPCSRVTLINQADNHIAFKLKTTFPLKYVVKPNLGMIAPNSNQVILLDFCHSGPFESEDSAEHKFMIEMTRVTEEDIKQMQTTSQTDKIYASIFANV